MTNILTKIIKANQEYEILGGGSSSAGEEHEVITQAAYDALTPAQKAEKVYMIKESGTPGTVLTAGAGIDITNNEISADMSTAVYDNTTSGATATNVQDAIDEVFQSVSNGKTIIAAAITDKGVPTAASDSFQTMASNIGLIETAGDYDAFVTKQYTKTKFYQDGGNNNIIYVYPTGDFFNQDKSKYYRYFMVFDTAQHGFGYYHLGIATKTENDDFVINVLGDTGTLASNFILYNNRKKIVGNDVYYSVFFSCRDIYQTPQLTTYYYINCTNSTLGNLVTIGNSAGGWTEETAYAERDTNCGISEAENINDVNKTTLSVQDAGSNYWDLIINLV